MRPIHVHMEYMATSLRLQIGEQGLQGAQGQSRSVVPSLKLWHSFICLSNHLHQPHLRALPIAAVLSLSMFFPVWCLLSLPHFLPGVWELVSSFQRVNIKAVDNLLCHFSSNNVSFEMKALILIMKEMLSLCEYCSNAVHLTEAADQKKLIIMRPVVCTDHFLLSPVMFPGSYPVIYILVLYCVSSFDYSIISQHFWVVLSKFLVLSSLVVVGSLLFPVCPGVVLDWSLNEVSLVSACFPFCLCVESAFLFPHSWRILIVSHSVCVMFRFASLRLISWILFSCLPSRVSTLPLPHI